MAPSGKCGRRLRRQQRQLTSFLHVASAAMGPPLTFILRLPTYPPSLTPLTAPSHQCNARAGGRNLLLWHGSTLDMGGRTYPLMPAISPRFKPEDYFQILSSHGASDSTIIWTQALGSPSPAPALPVWMLALPSTSSLPAQSASAFRHLLASQQWHFPLHNDERPPPSSRPHHTMSDGGLMPRPPLTAGYHIYVPAQAKSSIGSKYR